MTPKINMGILDSFKKVVANSYSGNELKALNSDGYLQSCAHIVDAINSLEHDLEALSDELLLQKTSELKDRLRNGASLDDILPEAFAVVREASWRVLGLRHYDVQVIFYYLPFRQEA